jgi:hypothetical protein
MMIGLKSPLENLIKNGGLSRKSSTYPSAQKGWKSCIIYITYVLCEEVIMKKVSPAMLFLCLMVLCCLSVPSFAIMKGLSTEELTKDSDIVILGEVENIKSLWARQSLLDLSVISSRITEGSL